MIVVDASVLLAFLAQDDPHHTASRVILASDDAFGAHTITLAESLVRAERDGRAAEVSWTIERLGVREADRLQDEPGRLARLRVATRLPMPDCCVLMLATAGPTVLATFDARLASVARERGIEVLDGGR